MVVFTCSRCGQSIKKNQVENHCNYQCRGCESISCMDCGKVFWGDEYKQHVKCITEDQKYGGKDYQPKPSSNKGEVKQEKWIEHIKNTIATKKISGPLSRLLEQMIQYNNIPRKKSKFENFLKNSLKFRNLQLIAQAWEIFDQSNSKEPNLASANAPAVNAMNGSVKRPLDDKVELLNKKPCLNGVESSEGQNSQTFDWAGVIERILLNNSENAMPMKTLRKQVLNEYRNSIKCSTLTKEDLKKKFNEVVSNSNIFIINKS